MSTTDLSDAMQRVVHRRAEVCAAKAEIVKSAVLTKQHDPRYPTGVFLKAEFEGLYGMVCIEKKRRREPGFVRQSIDDLFVQMALRKVADAGQR
jgi:hypothetical protein